MDSRDRVICYHFPCADGVFAALMAYMALEDTLCTLSFVPLRTSEDPILSDLQLTGDEVVYILDYDAPLYFIRDVASCCSQVIIIDHHHTTGIKFRNKKQLPSNVKLIFNKDKCGAVLAMEHFKLELSDDLWIMIKLVEDHDLFTEIYSDTRAFQAGLRSLTGSWDYNENDNIFEDLLDLNLWHVIKVGENIVKRQQYRIDDAISQAFIVDLSKAGSWGRCLAVQGNHYRHLRSYIGRALAEKSKEEGMRGIAIIAYSDRFLRNPSLIKLSFRGLTGEDTTKISTLFGGGGHEGASGCLVNRKHFNRWKA